MQTTNVHTSKPAGWFDIYVDDLKRAAAFYGQVLDRPLSPLGDPTDETRMMAFATDMGLYGAGGALVKSDHAHPGMGGTLVHFSVEDGAVEAARVLGAGGRVVRAKFPTGELG